METGMRYRPLRAIKTVVCEGLMRTGFVHTGLKAAAWRKAMPVPIINYHSFVERIDGAMETHPCVTQRIDVFREELRFFKRVFDLITLDELPAVLREGRRGRRPVLAVTVDDGFRNNYELLFPVLREEGVRVTIFLATGPIDGRGPLWVDRLAAMIRETREETIEMPEVAGGGRRALDSVRARRTVYGELVGRLKDVEGGTRRRVLEAIEERLGRPRHLPEMLTWGQVRRMRAEGIVFGAHTVTHPILTRIPHEEACREILESKQRIEEELGEPVRHFAYPNGRPEDFNEALREYCREIGFETVSTCTYGVNRGEEDLMALKRIGTSSPFSVCAVNVLRLLK